MRRGIILIGERKVKCRQMGLVSCANLFGRDKVGLGTSFHAGQLCATASQEKTRTPGGNLCSDMKNEQTRYSHYQGQD